MTKLNKEEFRFAILISSVHGMQHFFLRLLPPLIPLIAIQTGLPLWKLGLLITSQYAGSAIGQAPAGIISDKYDRRLFLPCGLALAGLGYALLLFTPLFGESDLSILGEPFPIKFLFMAFALFINGIGMSVVHPTGYPIISRNVRAEVKGKFYGMWGSASKLGDAIGPAVLGLFFLFFVWTDILVLLGLIGIFYAIILYIGLGNYDTTPLLTPSTKNSSEPSTLSDSLPPRRKYLYPLLAVFTFFTIYSFVATGVMAFLPEFIIREYSYTLTVGSLLITPESTASFYLAALLFIGGLAQLLTGELVDRYDARKVIAIFVIFSSFFITVFSILSLSPLLLFLILGAMGISFWGISPARDSLLSTMTPPEREGRTFGYLWTGIFIFSAFSPIIIGYVGDDLGLRFGFGILSLITLLSLIPILFLFSRYSDLSLK